MTTLGRFLALLDVLPGKLLAAPDVDAEDVRLVADKLDHAAVRCRAVAGCKAGAAPPPTPRLRSRRARAC